MQEVIIVLALVVSGYILIKIIGFGISKTIGLITSIGLVVLWDMGKGRLIEEGGQGGNRKFKRVG